MTYSTRARASIYMFIVRCRDYGCPCVLIIILNFNEKVVFSGISWGKGGILLTTSVELSIMGSYLDHQALTLTQAHDCRVEVGSYLDTGT